MRLVGGYSALQLQNSLVASCDPEGRNSFRPCAQVC